MEPAACCWSFADEHLHWVLEHTPARRLLSLAAVARQWHAVVAELMRLRARASPQQWSAAMACGPGRDFSTKAKARAACLELLSRATRHALTPMLMLPDLAIVFVSDATKHADAVADVASALHAACATIFNTVSVSFRMLANSLAAVRLIISLPVVFIAPGLKRVSVRMHAMWKTV